MPTHELKTLNDSVFVDNSREYDNALDVGLLRYRRVFRFNPVDEQALGNTLRHSHPFRDRSFGFRHHCPNFDVELMIPPITPPSWPPRIPPGTPPTTPPVTFNDGGASSSLIIWTLFGILSGVRSFPFMMSLVGFTTLAVGDAGGRGRRWWRRRRYQEGHQLLLGQHIGEPEWN